MPAGEEAWGLFNGVFSPVEPGEHVVQLSCAEAGSSLETKISIQGTSREKRGQPARLDRLKDVVIWPGKVGVAATAIAAPLTKPTNWFQANNTAAAVTPVTNQGDRSPASRARQVRCTT